MFKLLREIKNLLKEIRDELRKSNEPSRFVEKPFKRSFIGNDITKKKEIQNRKSFAEQIKKSVAKITYAGIPYKNKNYIFDGWKNHIEEVISFEVFEDYLLLNLEGQTLYALPQEDLTKNRERAKKLKEKSLKLLKDFDNLLIEARKN